MQPTETTNIEAQLAELSAQMKGIAETLEQVKGTGKVAAKEQKRVRRDLGMVAIQAQFTDFGVTALLCALCVGVVGTVKAGVVLRESIQDNAPPWLVAMIYPGLASTNTAAGGEFASPIVGKSLQDLVNYQPSYGQSFGPETGNQRSYGAHGGVDFDCRVGGCAGADVATPISGTVISIRQIGTSANGGSFQIDIDGTDWDGAVTHQLVHVDNILVELGDTVNAGQTVAKVSPTDTVSTGPHLDWKIRRNGSWVNPQKWAATAVEKGTRGSGNSFVDRYVSAIAKQESGANYGAVNPHSGALGKYQFMPATLVSTAQNCPGVSSVPSQTEFLNSPDLQDKIMGCYVALALPTIQGKASDEYTQCRMLGAYHYSGDPDLYNNTNPQSYAGAAYPSIADYTKAVCQGF